MIWKSSCGEYHTCAIQKTIAAFVLRRVEMNTEGIVLMVAGYLIGSLPTGVIVSTLFSTKDIRQEGSGNIGATNVYRVLGVTPGLLTLGGDVVKGSLPVILTSYLLGNERWVAAVALVTFLGHLYPVFLKFRGGKGVATALGIFVVIAPPLVPLAVLVFILVVVKWKYVSGGSLAASASMPLLLCLTHYPLVYVNVGFAVAVLIFFRHRDNIKRLREGREHKIARVKG
jgi:glycerol-3-phosphate acyltransferase PlsY